MDWIFLAELAINGALTGLLYSLFAIGLVLIYKASSVPNLAQGGLTMLGASVVLALSRDAGMPLGLAIPLAVVIMFGLGFGIERVALRRLAGRPTDLHGRANGAVIEVLLDHDEGTLGFRINDEPPVEVPAKNGTPFRFPKGAALHLCCITFQRDDQVTLVGRPWM